MMSGKDQLDKQKQERVVNVSEGIVSPNERVN